MREMKFKKDRYIADRLPFHDGYAPEDWPYDRQCGVFLPLNVPCGETDLSSGRFKFKFPDDFPSRRAYEERIARIVREASGNLIKTSGIIPFGTLSNVTECDDRLRF